jgi:hypothetical protein
MKVSFKALNAVVGQMRPISSACLRVSICTPPSRGGEPVATATL